MSLSIGEEGKGGDVAMNAESAGSGRGAVSRCLVNTGPQSIAVFMEVARHIERDRFDEDDDALLLARQPHAFAGHLRRIAPVRRHREDDTGNIAEDCKAVVVVEMSDRKSTRLNSSH